MTGTPHYALGTFSAAGCKPFAGMVTRERVIALDALDALARSLGARLDGTGAIVDLLDAWETNLPALNMLAAALEREDGAETWSRALDLAHVQVHAPLRPRQIICSGANYRKHVIDLIVDHAAGIDPKMPKDERRVHAEKVMNHRAANGKPFVFQKLASAVTGPYDSVVIPFDAKEPDWELELAVVIGKPARRVSRENALSHVAGYTIANDLTNREMLGRPDVPAMGMDWLAGKSAPTFLPLGPYVVPALFVRDPQDLQITMKLNGQMMQDASTSDMIFPVARIIEYASTQAQLMPGDIILTGSPHGNGTHYGRFIQAGDVLESSITGLGVQRNPCVLEGNNGAPSAVFKPATALKP